jgi:hypothetical protein
VSDAIGPHLLGRVPSPPDDRDYKMADVLKEDPLDATFAALMASPQVAAATKRWAQVVTGLLKATPAPNPQPSPPTPGPAERDSVWADPIQLDQGQTNHCVGFGWAGWGDADPVADQYQNADADQIYYECKVIDGEANQENGSTVRSGAKAMKNRGRVGSYVFAASIPEIRQWLQLHGPVVFGTDWTEDMFRPDAKGYIHPTGSVAGGHCYLALGDLTSEDAVLCENSWGASWGLGGRFKMKWADFDRLFSQGGEACGATELPLTPGGAPG